jgi:hypothetical protein
MIRVSRVLFSEVGWQLWLAVDQVGQQVFERLARRRRGNRPERVANLLRLDRIQRADGYIDVHQQPITR